jgi:hypothetical protein
VRRQPRLAGLLSPRRPPTAHPPTAPAHPPAPSSAAQTRGLSSANFKGKLLIERPNPQTNKFTGKVMLQNQPEVVLSINNVLLRGSSVRNTEYVIGLVVNTGRDSKVMQGMRAPLCLPLNSIDCH